MIFVDSESEPRRLIRAYSFNLQVQTGSLPLPRISKGLLTADVVDLAQSLPTQLRRLFSRQGIGVGHTIYLHPVIQHYGSWIRRLAELILYHQ